MSVGPGSRSHRVDRAGLSSRHRANRVRGGPEERPDSPLDRRDLEPALGKRAIESKQAVDDVMGERDLDAECQPGSEPRHGQLHNQARAADPGGTPEHLGLLDS